jgi:hypothetical protein
MASNLLRHMLRQLCLEFFLFFHSLAWVAIAEINAGLVNIRVWQWDF